MKSKVTRRPARRTSEAVLLLDVFPGSRVNGRVGVRPAGDAPVRIEIRCGLTFEKAAKALQQAHAALYRLGPKLNPRSTVWKQVGDAAAVPESQDVRNPPRKSKPVMKVMRLAEKTGFGHPTEKQRIVSATVIPETVPARTIPAPGKTSIPGRRTAHVQPVQVEPRRRR